jgi:hypothetical protein
MADRTSASVSPYLALIVENKVRPQINRARPGFQLIPKVPNEMGQKQVSWDVTFGTAGTGNAAVADGADLIDGEAAVDTLVQANLPMRSYKGQFNITGLADAMAEYTGNPSDLKNLKIFELDRCSQRLGVDMANDALYGDGVGDGTRVPVAGLLTPDPSDTSKNTGGLLDTGVYAGVSRSTYPQWAGNVVNASSFSGGSVSPSLFRKVITSIITRDALSRAPTVILASPRSWDKAASAFDPQRRYEEEINTVTTAMGNVITLDAGVRSMSFDGIPMIRDPGITETTTGTFLFLNLDEVAARYIPFPSAADIEAGDIQVTKSYGAVSTKTGLMYKMIKLAQNGDKERYALISYWQMQVGSCNSHGVVTGINIS